MGATNVSPPTDETSPIPVDREALPEYSDRRNIPAFTPGRSTLGSNEDADRASNRTDVSPPTTTSGDDSNVVSRLYPYTIACTSYRPLGTRTEP